MSWLVTGIRKDAYAIGDAVVQFPDWFEALNKDYRYSLTPIGAPAMTL